MILPLILWGVYEQYMYPQQLVAALNGLNAVSEDDYRTAMSTRDDLKKVWFYAGTADRLWGELNKRRLQAAITMDADPDASDVTAWKLAQEARQQLHEIGQSQPVFELDSRSLFHEFCTQRALHWLLARW